MSKRLILRKVGNPTHQLVLTAWKQGAKLQTVKLLVSKGIVAELQRALLLIDTLPQRIGIAEDNDLTSLELLKTEFEELGATLEIIPYK